MTESSPISSTGLSSATQPSAAPHFDHRSSGLGPQGRVPAWLLSLLLHSFIFAGLLLGLSQFQNGASDVENRSGGIVLVNSTSEATEYLSEGDVEQASEQSRTADSPPPTALNNELPPDLPGMETTETMRSGAGDRLVDSLVGADSLIDLPQSKLNIGGQVTTEVFGIKGTGSRFVYVIDRSKSMAGYGGRPIIAARQQMRESIDSLKKHNQFQIIFYNEGVRIFNPDGRPTMYEATDKTKEQAKEFIQRTNPTGGTDHVFALKRAFQLHPDVIFFLTDAEGGFTQRELRMLGDLNHSSAVINAIQFGIRPGTTPSLAAVARNSGGQYIFKNIQTLQINQ
ncbi:MAG: VWA domain-containing protein [Mariniblastus sp.]|nr:VWA domain-containing protein [Mariniblastus sp.]